MAWPQLLCSTAMTGLRRRSIFTLFAAGKGASQLPLQVTRQAAAWCESLMHMLALLL